MVKLGDKVRCIHSGFVGVAVSKTEFINGCIQFGVVPPVNKKAQAYPEEVNIDKSSLELVSRPKKRIKKDSDEGRTAPAPRMRGF